jgi:hypothetical protein
MNPLAPQRGDPKGGVPVAFVQKQGAFVRFIAESKSEFNVQPKGGFCTFFWAFAFAKN